MSFVNENVTEALAVLAQLAPANQTVAAHAIGPFNMGNFNRIVAFINVGVLGSSGTVDFQFQASTTSGGTYALVTGTQITQIIAGGTNYVMVELRQETLMNLGVGPFIKGLLTIGTAASQVGVEILGFLSSYKPESDYNLVTPTQVLVA